MQKEKFQNCLYHPETIDNSDISELKELLVRYPWFGTAGLLILVAGKIHAASDYETLFKKYRTLIPNRKLLQSLIYKNSTHKKPVEMELISIEPVGAAIDYVAENSAIVENHNDDLNSDSENISPSVLDDTSLLDFTYTPPTKGADNVEKIEKKPESTTDPLKTDDTEEYSQSKGRDFNHWIDQLERRTDTTKDSIIESFIHSDPGVIRADKETNISGDVSKNSAEENEDFITDTLAKIYVKQGLYNKAVYAYEKLCLKYPEKSVYFASQIEEIKSLYLKK